MSDQHEGHLISRMCSEAIYATTCSRSSNPRDAVVDFHAVSHSCSMRFCVCKQISQKADCTRSTHAISSSVLCFVAARVALYSLKQNRLLGCDVHAVALHNQHTTSNVACCTLFGGQAAQDEVWKFVKQSHRQSVGPHLAKMSLQSSAQVDCEVRSD